MTASSPNTSPASYRRILLKLSGEALMGDDAFGINRSTIMRMTDEIADVVGLGVELAVVIGGGNIFRGVAPGAQGMDRATADYMGMMATIMNALALQDALKHRDIDARVQSALNIEQVVEPYIRPKALRYLEEGKVVISVLINTQGRAEEVRLKKSSGYNRLDDAALRAVKTWGFRAGTRNGVAEAMWFDVPVLFRLDE